MASAWCSRPFHCRWTLGFFLGHYCELCSSELCACAPQCLCPRHCPLSPCLERTRGAMGPSAAPGDVPLLSRTVASGSTSSRGGIHTARANTQNHQPRGHALPPACGFTLFTWSLMRWRPFSCIFWSFVFLSLSVSLSLFFWYAVQIL